MASRKIEVQLVGDAGDLERSLAGALASLKAFGDGADKTGSKTNIFSRSVKDGETSLIDFEKAASKVNRTMSGGPFGLFDAVGNVGYAILRLGGFAQKGEMGLARLAGVGGDAESALTSLVPVVGAAAGGLTIFAAALVVLPALVAAVTFVVVALLDALTTLGAIAASLAGPLTIVAGLLGGLGAAFAFVAQQSFKNKATLQQQHDALLALHVAQQTYNEDLAKYGKNATQTEKALLALHKAQDAYATAQQGAALGAVNLDDKFHSLIATLSKDFQPEILKLATAAGRALVYLNQLAHLPLEAAFRNLSTKGVALMSKFVYGVANVLKKPFTLAVQIAFGSGGANAQSAITNWWDSLTSYLFGYSQRHPIKLGDHVIGFTTKQVAGALKPIQDWFNKQNFTKTALRWSNEIINGFVNSGGKARVAQWASAIGSHAGSAAGRAFRATLMAELRALPGLIKSQVFGLITSNLFTSASAQAAFIRAHLGQAWDAVKSKAISVWNSIKSFIESAISVHINWPSPPSWLHSLGSHLPGIPGFAGGVTNFGGGLAMVGERGPELVSLPRGSSVIPHGASVPATARRSLVGGSYSRRRSEMVVSFTDAEASKLQRATSRRSVRRG